MLALSLCLLLLCHCTSATLLGWVESPGYPRGYPPHASFNWTRCAHEGHTLSLRLTHLDLEDSHDCENDALEFFSDGNRISILCGQKRFEELESFVNPSLLSSTGGCLSLSFHSDYSNTKRHTGFRGFYTVQDFDECKDDPDNRCTQFCHNFIGGYRCSCRPGYHLDTDRHTCTVMCSKDLSGSMKGVISSPSWPGPYAENAHCLYTLSVEDHLQLELHFSEGFDVEQGPDEQCVDSLTVETSIGAFGPFCGQVSPSSPLLTSSNRILIRFTSDGYGSNNGFSIYYKTRVQTCPGVVASNSTVVPNQPEYHHGDTVTVTCEHGLEVDSDEDIQSNTEYATTCQRTGMWSPTYKCKPVNCGIPDVLEEDDIIQLVDSDDISTLFGDEVQFMCGSKYYTLEEGDTYICDASGDWLTVDGRSEFPRCTEVCGKTEKDISSAGRILGGKRAKLGWIPWQLFFEFPSLRPGASLINDRWAVTAAHVVDGYEEMPPPLYGGAIDTRTVQNTPSNVTAMETEKIIIHPDYAKGIHDERTNFDNDIALIRLASRVKLGPNLLPVCLPEADGGLRENQLGTVSGWGMTERNDISYFLRYAHVPVHSLSKCLNTPTLNNNRMVFTQNMFCAGAEGKDSCVGDSGGPFVSPRLGSGNRNGVGPYRLQGIVSWGPLCEEKQDKGYYTKVEKYLDWIQETIERVETEERGNKDIS